MKRDSTTGNKSFTEITSDQIVYLVVRVDLHKVLPAGYGAK